MYLAENIAYVNLCIQKYELPLRTVKTEATFLVWIDCSQMELTHEALLHFFIYKAKLGLNDGLSFGKSGEGFMRLNIGTSREVLEMAMQRIHHAYKEENV